MDKSRQGFEETPEIRLDIICLQRCFRFAFRNFSKYKIPGKTLWKMTTRIIPREYREKGIEALHFMRMLTYLSDDEKIRPTFSIKMRTVPNNIEIILQILSAYNLIKFKLPSWVKTNGIGKVCQNDFHEIDLDLHHEEIMKCIRRDNLDNDFEILKDCLIHFNLDGRSNQYCAVWNPAIKHEQLFKTYFECKTFIYNFTEDMNLKYPGLFKEVLKKYKDEGNLNKEKIALNAINGILTLKAGPPLDSAAKWKKWEKEYCKEFGQFLNEESDERYYTSVYLDHYAERTYSAGTRSKINPGLKIRLLNESLSISRVLVKNISYLAMERINERIFHCVLELPKRRKSIVEFIQDSGTMLKKYFLQQPVFIRYYGFKLWISIIEKTRDLITYEPEFKGRRRKSVANELLRLLKWLYRTFESDTKIDDKDFLCPKIVLLRLRCLKLLGDMKGIRRTIKKTYKLRHSLMLKNIKYGDDEIEEWNSRVDNFLVNEGKSW